MNQIHQIPSSGLFYNGDHKCSALLDSLVEPLEDIVILCSQEELNIKSLNTSAAQFLGAEKEELIGKKFTDKFPMSLPEDFIAEIKANTSDNEKIIEYKIDSYDDTTYTINASPLANNILIVIKTSGKRYDNIEESNFKMLFENMSSGFIFMKAVSDAGGVVSSHKILDVNSAFEIYFGKDKEQVIGKDISEVLEEFDDTWKKILAKSARTGYSYNGNFYYKKNNKHFEVKTYSPRKGYTAAVFNDIKHEMEIRNDLIIKNEISKAFALGHNTSLYKAVLDLVLRRSESNHGYIAYMSNNNNKLICLANQVKKITIKRDEYGNDIFEELPQAITEILNTKEQVLENNIDGLQMILTTPVIYNEKVIGIIACADPIKPYNTKSSNFIKGLADYISPLMSAEIKERLYKQELIEAKIRAEEGEKLKTAFLANISHEVRTPMNSIIGFCQLLNRTNNLSDKQQRYLECISQATWKLLYIMEDMMDMAKIQTQQVKVNISPVNVNEMLKKIYTEMSHSAEEKHLMLTIHAPLLDSESVILTDAYKIQKTIKCLVSNGIKFTNIGSVSFGYNLEGENIVFFVKDTGIGIREELHETIFSSFCQLENVMERKYNGVGVGLSLSKGFIDMLGGKIWVDSAPNNGSTFFIKIKYNKA